MSRVRMFVLIALTAFLGVIAGAAPGHAMCDPTTDPDRADIANARAAVAANCNCAGATSHAAYVFCAAQKAQQALVNKNCVGAVKRCAAHSTCGKQAGAVTCCVTKASGTKCKIKRDAAHCAAPPGATACVGIFTSCCDACTAGGCATTTTTTTTTSTTCPPAHCGDGVYQPACGEQCDGTAVGVCTPDHFGGRDVQCTASCGCCGVTLCDVPSSLSCCDPTAVCAQGPASPGGCYPTICSSPSSYCTPPSVCVTGMCCIPVGQVCDSDLIGLHFPCCAGLFCAQQGQLGLQCCRPTGDPCSTDAECCYPVHCNPTTSTCD